MLSGEADTVQVAEELSLLFLSNTRLFPWHKAKLLLQTSERQTFLYDKTIGHPLAVQYPIAGEYLQKFIKTWINQVDDCDVIEAVYDKLSETLSTSLTQHGYKIYSFDGCKSYLKIEETVAMCSKGTTGLQTWPASLVMCQWATHNSHLFKDKDVIELGCGAGLLGCTLATHARHVTLTDHHHTVLEVAQRNITVNNVTRASVRTLDWEQCGAVPGCDVVVAADVVFDPSILPSLAKTINIILKTSSAREPVCYICSTVRNKDTYSTFLTALADQELVVEDLKLAVRSCYLETGVDNDVRLLEIKIK